MVNFLVAVAQQYNHHFGACPSVGPQQRARNFIFGTKGAYVTAFRPEKGFCEISIFRPFFAENAPFSRVLLVSKIAPSFFIRF